MNPSVFLRAFVRRWLVPVAALATMSPAIPAASAASSASCAAVSDPAQGRPAAGSRFMVASAHPAASRAGCSVLARGGSAIDAAVAVQAVLAVVEPQASGLAGGAVITYWDRAAARVRFYDGLASAPRAATRAMREPAAGDSACELTPSGLLPLGVNFTGRAFGIPGTLRALELAHRSHGRLAWNTLFDAAIEQATAGFALPRYLHTLIGERARPGGVGAGLPRCRFPDLAARYCGDADTPLPLGTVVRNPEIARTLTLVRDRGVDAFYDPAGPVVAALLERLRAGSCKPGMADGGAPVVPSLASAEDFAGYRAKERTPLCRAVLGHVVCTAPPPSFGGTAVLQMLATMEANGLRSLTPGSPAHTHLALEASRLAQADRRAYIGDPDFSPVAVAGLLDPAYLKRRSASFSRDRALAVIEAGTPAPVQRAESGDPATATQDETSHMSIVDGQGNALAMTTTNNTSFGAQMEAAGMILNNAMVNFTRAGTISAGADVNGMEPAKRPRTAMSPTVVFDRDRRLRLVVGAAGGSAIPDYVAGAITGVVAFGLDPQRALAQPHTSGQSLTSRCGDQGPGFRSEVERGTPLAAQVPGLRALGHPCARATRLRSGLAAIAVDPEGRLTGAADPRRDGIAVGE